jgi:hypothetical protein
MNIYNNVLTQNQRSAGYNGQAIVALGGIRDSKIYSNTIAGALPAQDNNDFCFTFELWYSGGLEMYDNTITGFIDFGKDCTPGTSDYVVDFHHNTVGWNTLQSVYTDGIQFEQATGTAIIRNNIFKNLERPIYYCAYNYAGDYIEDAYIYDNIIYNVGKAGGTAGNGIYFETGPIPPSYVDNINIWNNVIVGSGSSPRNGIYLPTADEVTNINIKNNVITGFGNAPIFGEVQASGGSIDTMSIENNLFYNNGNSNVPRYSSITPSNLVYRNNIFANPLFVSSSNFHLQSTSPAINKGLNVGLTEDYEGNSIVGLPDIGAFEYQ